MPNANPSAEVFTYTSTCGYAVESVYVNRTVPFWESTMPFGRFLLGETTLPSTAAPATYRVGAEWRSGSSV